MMEIDWMTQLRLTTAISINPNYAEAFNNMGIALNEQGKPEEAIAAYTKALSIRPDYAEAFNNMGNALKEMDRLDDAIEAYKEALEINGDYPEAYFNTGNALKGVIFNKPNRDFQNTIISILNNQKYVRPNDISEAAISLLKLEPTLQKQLADVDGDQVKKNPLNLICGVKSTSIIV